MRLLLVLSAGIMLVLGTTGSGALASSQETCSNGTISGEHGSVTVTGTCWVDAPGVTIKGDLTLADGAVFAPYAIPAFTHSPIHVTGNVKVGKGAQLLLGYDMGDSGELGTDTVDGNIVANQPLALYLGNITVHGSVVSIGGGSSERFYNFPIKDNKIDGNLIIFGWTGGWWGVIANTVGGNVDAHLQQERGASSWGLRRDVPSWLDARRGGRGLKRGAVAVRQSAAHLRQLDLFREQAFSLHQPRRRGRQEHRRWRRYRGVRRTHDGQST